MWTPEKEQEADAIEADVVFDEDDQDDVEEETEENEKPKKSKKELRIALIKARAEKLRAKKARMAAKKAGKEPKKTGKDGGKMSKYVRGTLIKSIYAYFDEKWPDVIYEDTEKLAKQIKPDTKFNKYHFSWYKNDFCNRRDIENIHR